MIGAVVSWLTSRTAKRLAGRVAKLYLDREETEDEVEKARIDAEIRQTEARLEVKQQAVEAATQVRQGSRVMEFLTLVAGLPLTLHLAAVCLDSTVPGLFPGWTVHALPPPMDQWQGVAILTLFGAAGLLRWRGR